MRERFTKGSQFVAGVIAVAALVVCFPRTSLAQNAPGNANPRVTIQPGSDADRARRTQAEEEKPSGPAPVHDFSGMWAGMMEALLSNRIPPMTAAGKAKLDANIPDPFSSSSNDPWKYCDPFGMPRAINNQTGQLGFAQMPGRIILMEGFQRNWREIWMDGRQAPKNIGHEGGPSAMMYGYSIGRWDGNNVLVIETVGMDEKTWMDRRGYPHSVDAKVTERYARADFDHLSMTENIEDPAYYTQSPFILAKLDYRYVKNQVDKNTPIPFTNEQLCISSQAQDYMKLIGDPADIDGATGQKKK